MNLLVIPTLVKNTGNCLYPFVDLSGLSPTTPTIGGTGNSILSGSKVWRGSWVNRLTTQLSFRKKKVKIFVHSYQFICNQLVRDEVYSPSMWSGRDKKVPGMSMDEFRKG
jgi:hypothetical protein